jgi:hypothetical protein
MDRFVGPRSIGDLLLHLLRTGLSLAGVAAGVLLDRPELTAFFTAAVLDHQRARLPLAEIRLDGVNRSATALCHVAYREAHLEAHP